jgi:hypothetical protein
MKLSFPTKVINGLISSNRQPITEAIKSFEGKEIVLTIERKRKKRSNEQNAYLWGVVYPILKDGFYQIGYKLTTGQVHELMKQTFVKEDLINETTGEVKTITGHTSNLTTSQFMEYLADIKQFAAEELNVYIPDPNEQVNFNF